MIDQNKIWTFKLKFHVCSIYLLCIRMIFNYCDPAILACTSCERLMRSHCPLTWAWWNIDTKKSHWTQKHRIYLLASYNKWMHTCMEQVKNFKKDIRCISIVKYIFRCMFFTLANWWNAIMRHFIRVWTVCWGKKRTQGKNIIFSSRRKR